MQKLQKKICFWCLPFFNFDHAMREFSWLLLRLCFAEKEEEEEEEEIIYFGHAMAARWDQVVCNMQG